MPPNLFVILIDMTKEQQEPEKPLTACSAEYSTNNSNSDDSVECKTSNTEDELKGLGSLKEEANSHGNCDEDHRCFPNNVKTDILSSTSESLSDKIVHEENKSTGDGDKTRPFVQIQELLHETFEKMKFDQLLLYDPVWTYGNGSGYHLQITFPCKESKTALVTQRLENIGIGLNCGALIITPSAYTHVAKLEKADDKTLEPDDNPQSLKNTLLDVEEQKRVIEHCSKIRVKQVLEQVKHGAKLSFDYIMLVSVAATLAGVGLATDNTVVIVASMLVSPIMGPILAFTFGTTVRDPNLIAIGLRNELISLLACLFIGIIIGLIGTAYGVDNYWPTNEMESRGSWMGLVLGIAIAVPSGMGVALSILGNNTSSLVGVAISASLLPPAVNCGMLAAFALTADYMHPHLHVVDKGLMIQQATASLCLTLVNIACIFITSIIMFKVKEVAPIKEKAAFWARDVKVVKNRHRSPLIRQDAKRDRAIGGDRPNALTLEKKRELAKLIAQHQITATNPYDLLSMKPAHQNQAGHVRGLFGDMSLGLDPSVDYLDGIGALFEESDEDLVENGVWNLWGLFDPSKAGRTVQQEDTISENL